MSVPKTLTSKVARGSLLFVLGQGLTLGASLVATPFVIRLLGTELYGVLVLINLFIGYLTYSDFGMGTASTKFGSEFFVRNDEQGEASVVWMALIIALIPASLVAITVAGLSQVIVANLLHLPEHLQRQAAIALCLAALGFIFRTASNVLNTPQLVRLRIDLNVAITSGFGVLQILLVPLVLWNGGKLIEAVAVVALANAATLFSHTFVSSHLLPRLLHPQFNTKLARPMIAFGGASIVSGFAAILVTNTEKLILGTTASVSALAHYSVAFTLSSMVAMIPGATSQSLFPAFTQLITNEDASALQRLYSRAIRANFMWLIPAILILSVVAKPFFTLWAGEEFGRESTFPFYILLGGLIFNVIAYVPATMLSAMGRVNLIAKIYLAELFPYLLIVSALTYFFGAEGAAISWSARVIFDAFIFFYFVKKSADYSIPSFFSIARSYIGLSALLIPTVCAIIWLNLNAVAVLTVLAFLLIGYSAIAWYYLLNVEERDSLKSLLQKFKSQFIS